MSLSLSSVSLSNVVAVAEEHTRELPMSPYAYGAVAFCGFLVLLGVLWAFRGTAQKIAAGHGPHGSEYQDDAHDARAARADQQGSPH
jgi:hypothetical protein